METSGQQCLDVRCALAATSLLYRSCVVLVMWPHKHSLFEIMAEPVRVQTYATMRSDSSETSAFFSWTSWIQCSIMSGEPLLPASKNIKERKKFLWSSSLRKGEDVVFLWKVSKCWGTRFICSIWHNIHVSVCLEARTLTPLSAIIKGIQPTY